MPRTRHLMGAVVLAATALAACSSGAGSETTSESTRTTATPSGAMADTSVAEADGAGGSSAGDGYDWSDVRRRQAVSMAIDRQELVEVMFQGTRKAAGDFWPDSIVGHRGDGWCRNLQHDPDQAAALWEEAGGDAGPLTLWFNADGDHQEWVEAVGNQLQATLGVAEVAFESLPFGGYLDKLKLGEVDGPFRLGWLMDYPSPASFLGPLHGTAGSSNLTGYSNEAFDEAVAAGNAMPLEESVADYQAAGDILCEDMPIAPLFFGLLQAVHSEDVEDVTFNAFQQLEVTEITDVDGDGAVSIYICEPINPLIGALTNEVCGAEVLHGLFAGLWTLDKDSGELVFDEVAQGVESDEQGTEWTITLKDGWTFHDGTPVTAHSFVDAWNWAAYTPNAAQNSYFFSIPQFAGHADVSTCGTRAATQEDVDAEVAGAVGDEIRDCETQPPAVETMSGLEAVDDQTIRISLDAPFPQLPLVLLYNAFDPLPPSFFAAAEQGPEAVTAWGEAPVGNGPFMIPEGGGWEHNRQVATVAYPDFAGPTPDVDAVTYRIYSEETAAYNDMRSGLLDVSTVVPIAELTTAQDEFGERYIEEQMSSFNFFGFPVDLELAASWRP